MLHKGPRRACELAVEGPTGRQFHGRQAYIIPAPSDPGDHALPQEFRGKPMRRRGREAEFVAQTCKWRTCPVFNDALVQRQ